MEGGTNLIITVRTCKFTIAGREWPVAHVDIGLKLNTIPYAVITLPPHVYESSGLTIQDQGLKNVKEGMDWFNKQVEQGAESNLELVLESNTGRTETVSLKKWVLTNASVSTMNTTTGHTVTCRIEHPACNMYRHGCYHGNLEAPLTFSEMPVSVGNIVEAADEVVKEIVAAEKISLDISGPYGLPHASGYSEIQGLLERLYGVMSEKAMPSKYLEWTTDIRNNDFGYSDMPLKSLSDKSGELDVADATELAVLHSLVPDIESSVWESFLSAASLWGVSVIPAFLSEKLPVIPSSPWSKPMHRILDSSISQFSFPAFDNDPVIGVRCTPVSYGCNLDTSSLATAVDNKIYDLLTAEMFYVPKGIVGKPEGKFINISAPPWFSVLQQTMASLRSAITDGSSNSTSGVTAGVNDMCEILYNAQIIFASYVFQMSYKQNMTASMLLPITVHLNNFDLLPGQVILVTDGSYPVLEGYIVSMNHSFDVTRSTATTSVTMGYCRPYNGYKDIAEDGDANPMYK